MAAPTVNSVGAVLGATGTSKAFGAPGTIGVDDILILISLTNSTTTFSGLPSGWAHVTGSPVTNSGSGGIVTLDVCWKRAVVGDVGAGSYTFTQSASDYSEGAIVAVRGAINTGIPWDTGAGAPAFAASTSPLSTAPAVSLTTQGSDRLLVNGAIQFNGGTWTASAGFTVDFQSNNGTTTAGVCAGFHKAQAVAGATGSVQPTISAAAAGMVNFLGALMPTAGAAAVFVAATPTRRRVQAPRRRPKATQFVPAQVIVPPMVRQAVRPRLRAALVRRYRNEQIVPPQVSVAPPNYPPAPVRVRLRAALARRMRNDMPPVDQTPAPPPEVPRRRGILPRRGRTVQVVPAQVTQINPPYPFTGLRPRLRGALSRRGRTVQVVPPQVAPPVSVWSPQPVRVRVRAALARRGRVVMPPAMDARVPLFARLRARLVPPRRARMQTVVPPQIVVTPPAYPPQPVHRTRRGMRRRTHGAEGWMVGAAVAAIRAGRLSSGTGSSGPSSGSTQGLSSYTASVVESSATNSAGPTSTTTSGGPVSGVDNL